MTVTLKGVSKRYDRHWILKNLDFSFRADKTYAITGPNGSGKSTLIQLISGSLTPTKGIIQYELKEKCIPVESIFRHLVLCAPYVQLIEEFTLEEMVIFHGSLKPYLAEINTPKAVVEILQLEQHRHKQLCDFSSGMKQRTLLGLSILSDVPLLLLDEPTTNLDRIGAEWYRDLINKFGNNRLIIISSNQYDDYSFCDYELKVDDFKPTEKR